MAPPIPNRIPSSKLRLNQLSLCFLSQSTQNGFSLIEVLVALMVTMIFIAITMQMFVSAAYFRSKGDQYNQAFNWIQEDYEGVFNKASQYENDVQPASALCSATTPANGLAASFLADTTLGLGGTSTTLGPKTFGGKSFMLTRSGDYATSDNPYKLLRLNYAVTPSTGGAAIANINTEVVIYAGFKCP
jgi:prepilin-type N-terminal cleavage/methylation domain-containing protein